MTSGIQSIPSTPHVSKTANIKNMASRSKKTVLDFDGNDSYIEEYDATYFQPETSMLTEEDSDLSLDEISEEDLKDYDALNDETLSETDKDTFTSSQERVESKEVEYSILRQFLTKHEIPRKVLHSSIGVVTLYLYSVGVRHTQIIPVLVTLFSIIFVNDYIRFHNPEFNKKVIKFWWFIIRQKEIDSYNGTLWFLLGLSIVFALYPKDISVMSVLLLSWADTAASTFGRLYGKYTPQITNGKSLAGSAASFVTGSAACYLFYGFFIPTFGPHVDREGDIMWSSEESGMNLHLFALFTGIFASVSEFINLFHLDDNFTIPVLSSALLFAVVKVFQY